MGEPMVRTLLRAGFTVTSCAHRRREPLERLREAGLLEAADPAAVADQSEITIVCVPDAPQVEEAIFGDRGVASGARVEPVLRALGTPTHLGPVGMGETVKLANQAIIASVMLANVEALVLAERLGADRDAVREVLATATASNYLLEHWLPKTWFAKNFAGGFALDLLRKDLAAALEAARSLGHPMPATGLAYQLYTARSAEGDGALDYSAIAKAYERDDSSKTVTRNVP